MTIRVTDWLRGQADYLSRLVCPPECAWCQAPCPGGERFCQACREKLAGDYYCCQRCATPLPGVLPNASCFRCRSRRWKFSQVIALGPYRGRLREAVILSKKHSYESLRVGLAGLLAQRLASQLRYAGDQPPILVPVPNHWTRIFAQTAATADSLAYAIGDELGWDVTAGIVRRIRRTAKQGMLAWSQREQNVRRAFQVIRRSTFAGRHICVVDDVLTSGATAAELARCLIHAGAQGVTIVVIARGTGARDRN
jgi:predicted amidophosphoribosyltransferase